MSLIPQEIREQLDRASVNMDAMNEKLDSVTALLVEIRDALKEKS